MRKLLQLLADNRGPRAPVQLEGSTLYVYDAIVGTNAEADFWGGVSAEALVPVLLNQPQGATLTMRINSGGGDAFAGQAILNAMRQSPATINVEVDGLAASAASIIALGGDRVRIAEGAMLMIHNAWIIAMGNAQDMIETAALLSKVDDTAAQQYADKTGKDKARMAELMAAETWFTAAEALDIGLVNEIVKPAAKAQAQASAPAKVWNLSAYSKPPQAACQAPQPPAEPVLSPEQARALMARVDKRWRRAA
jgi:ATP-dependent protease ClpP protease subunit